MGSNLFNTTAHVARLAVSRTSRMGTPELARTPRVVHQRLVTPSRRLVGRFSRVLYFRHFHFPSGSHGAGAYTVSQNTIYAKVCFRRLVARAHRYSARTYNASPSANGVLRAKKCWL